MAIIITNIITWVRTYYKYVVITLAAVTFFIVAYVFGGNIVKSLFFDKSTTSTIVTNSTKNEDLATDESIKTLTYLQNWLNFWAPYVFDCIEKNVPVEQCTEPAVEKPPIKKYTIKEIICKKFKYCN